MYVVHSYYCQKAHPECVHELVGMVADLIQRITPEALMGETGSLAGLPAFQLALPLTKHNEEVRLDGT